MTGIKEAALLGGQLTESDGQSKIEGWSKTIWRSLVKLHYLILKVIGFFPYFIDDYFIIDLIMDLILMLIKPERRAISFGPRN